MAQSKMKISDIKANPNNPRLYECLTCKKEFSSNKGCVSRTPKYCSKQCYSKREITSETIMKMSDAKKGKSPWNKKPRLVKNCNECKKDILIIDGGVYNRKYCSNKCRSEAYKKADYSYLKGSKSHFWRGGICGENELERKSGKYRNWRKSVFDRDEYTCILCKQKGGYLHADHIKPFAHFKELRFDINNGRTLCIECHLKTDTYGYKSIKYGV